jgi:DNA invertase Pin-like site-specific DNA recombinase
MLTFYASSTPRWHTNHDGARTQHLLTGGPPATQRAAAITHHHQHTPTRGAGCTKIYREKVTGARADWRELNRMLGKLAPGDVVTVTRIDRLARSTFDLFGIIERIVDAKAQFRSLAEPWADTGTSTGRLMLAVLGGLADVERDLIRTRTAEGRSRAKAQGKHIGRPPSLTPTQRKEAIRRRSRARRCRNWRTATTAA